MENIVYNTKTMTGVICHGQEALICPGKGIYSLPLDLARGIRVLRFDARVRGQEAIKWAKFWLMRADKKALKVGVTVATPDLLKESQVTARQCRKEFDREVARKNSLRKGVKMIAVSGSWFSDKEQPIVGLGAYRPTK